MNYKIEGNCNDFKYPNLIAEFIESHYSFCTLAEHMGLGRRSEYDPETRAKLTGAAPIMYGEALGLCQLFGVNMEYLFSDKLKTISGQSIAAIRWFKENKAREKELRRIEVTRQITEMMKQSERLFDFIAQVITLNPQQLDHVIESLKKRGVHNEF